MKPSIPWLRVLIEGVVIVGSILLAFGIDAWWEGRQERRTAYRELITVSDELDQSRTELAFTAALHERSRSGTSALLTRLETVPVDAPVAVSDSLVTLLVLLFRSEAPTTALDAFIASGRLEELDQDEVKRELLAWGTVVQDLLDDENRARDHLDRDVVPYVRAEFDATRALDLLEAMVGNRLDPTQVGETKLRSTVSLRNLVAWQRVFLQVLSNQSRSAIERLDKLRALLREDLAREAG